MVIKRLIRIYSLVRLAYGKYKFQIMILVVLGFLSGLLEGLGINALIPLFNYAIGGPSSQDFISRKIEAMFGYFSIKPSIPYLLGLIIVLFVLKAVLYVIFDYIKLRITADYEYQTRSEVFQQILTADWPHLSKQKLGYLETIMAVDIPAAGSLMRSLGQGLLVGTGLLIYTLVAINISFSITMFTLGAGAAMFLFLKPAMRRIKKIATERNLLMKESAHHISENVLGLKTVKAMLAESGVLEKGQSFFSALKAIVPRAVFVKTVTTAFIEPASIIFIAFVFVYWYGTPGFNVSALAAIVYLIHQIFTYVQQIQSVAHGINDDATHLKSILDYRQEAKAHREINQGRENFSFKDNIAFDQVCFSYDADRQVLSDLSFSIKKGEMIGLIGPSGVGKTTLVDLLLRLLVPTKGQILLDGRNISEIDLQDWRSRLGYVSQDIFLINDTIAANIRFYNPGLSQADIEDAARMANIHEFITALPAGYETMIGERGIRLSGGERQRVVLARVLARKPEILILDEATSALDNESEAVIQAVIKKLKGRVTVLAIAHRLSTIMDSDQLIVLEQGKIAEKGVPSALLTDERSYFFRTYNIVKNR